MLISTLETKANLERLIIQIKNKNGVKKIPTSKHDVLKKMPENAQKAVYVLNDAIKRISQLQDLIEDYAKQHKKDESAIFTMSVEIGKLKVENEKLKKQNEKLLQNIKI